MDTQKIKEPVPDILEEKEAALLALFRTSGYGRCHLTAFDEYELFNQNRAFLEGDHMLTFTDPHGKLYALRPDVTLSVMKQAVYQPQNAYRVYYRENVYRLSPETHQYEARAQVGAECIEKEAESDGSDMLLLALKALQVLGDRSVLAVSHMGFLINNVWYQAQSTRSQSQILSYMSQKNRHDLSKYLQELQCPEEEMHKLMGAIRLTGTAEAVLAEIKKEDLGTELYEAAHELKQLLKSVPADQDQQIIVDFSLVNPLGYYNGLVFQGFMEGSGSSVLSGGRYDNLAKRFLKPYADTCGAIGFAVDLTAAETAWRRLS